jgi:hypothetical protein
MWSFIKWAIGVRPEKQSLTHNSMGILPESTFINYARDKAELDEDEEPHSSIYHLKRMERLYGKSQKRKSQFNSYYDYFNH